MKALLLFSLFAVIFGQTCPKVKVYLYTESYCPGCQSYTINQLNAALTAIPEIIDFQVWPYGNAQEKQAADGGWTFTCQHGVNECIGNVYQSCAIEHFNTTTGSVPTWWPYFLCLEKSQKAGDVTTASGCAKNNGLDWTVIDACAGSDPTRGTLDDGNKVEHQMALDTNVLQPPHQWTPWVVVNGAPLSESQLDLPLIPIVCKDYTSKAGCTAPAGCSNFVSEMLSRRD